MDRIGNSPDIQSETAASLAYPDVSYGVAAGVEAAVPTASVTSSLSISGYISYLFSEYLSGIMFVMLSAAFIFAVPVWAVRPRQAVKMVYKTFKRLTDIIVASVGLILTLPFWVVIPILLKLESPGPVFYIQERVGLNKRRQDRRILQKDGVAENRRSDRRNDDLNGRPFNMIKFRTMVQDAEKKCGPVWATKNDPRITCIGAFLRKTRLDEIPQFINVLWGDMSMVGPRPERPAFVNRLAMEVDGYVARLQVKPGLTGLAQVENGYDSSVDSVVRKVRYDLDYIARQSIWLDIKILAKTVVVVLTGKGAC